MLLAIEAVMTLALCVVALALAAGIGWLVRGIVEDRKARNK